MTADWRDVQRIVLHGRPWALAKHLVLCFGNDSQAPHFLEQLRQADPTLWPSAADPDREAERTLQVSLGFSRRGLEQARVPSHVLALFALKAPAFWAGAAARAGRQLALSGVNGPIHWRRAFGFLDLDAVLSLHAKDRAILAQALRTVRKLAKKLNVRIRPLVRAGSLDLKKGDKDSPPGSHDARGGTEGKGEGRHGDPQIVHFGYRDGLSRIGIRGWPAHEKSNGDNPGSQHHAGEFLLGHPQDSGANPWIAGPGLRVWPEEMRKFFCNGSFGVLMQVQQHIAEFEAFVDRSATSTGLEREEIKAKLCGRDTTGRPLAAPDKKPEDDFDYGQDAHGYRCPFGAHIRRMNPRGGDVPHAVRVRPLLRRGMPYGNTWCGKDDGIERGLLGQFFCASIEDQFEHLVGQWGDRVPIGSEDRGGARDPLMGAHESGDGPFEIPREDKLPLLLEGLQAFTRTRGVAYLFYPSLRVLDGMTLERPWYALDEDGP